MMPHSMLPCCQWDSTPDTEPSCYCECQHLVDFVDPRCKLHVCSIAEQAQPQAWFSDTGQPTLPPIRAGKYLPTV